MKTYSIRCQVTGTVLDDNLSLDEVKTTLSNYFNDDFCLDIDEVIKYCEFQEISLLDYFIDNHKFDSDLTNVIDRYEVLDNIGEIISIDRLSTHLYNEWNFHWFYEINNPKFRITDDNCIYESYFWSDLKDNFNWQILDIYTFMYDLLKTGKYNYIDMSARDSFLIEIIK